jgi:hypothetical protein
LWWVKVTIFHCASYSLELPHRGWSTSGAA